MKKGLSYCLVILLCMLFVACKPRTPKGVLSQAKMEEILYDYHLAQSAAEQGGDDRDKLRYKYAESVFLKHGITRAEFDSSMVWYSAHSDLLFKIYKNLNSRLESEAKGLGVGVSDTEMYANISEIGDTANIWSGSKILFLENNCLHNYVSINMTADSTFLPGDTYLLSFNSNFLNGDHDQAFVFLTVIYKDGTVNSINSPMSASYSVKLNLPKRSEYVDAETDKINISFFYPLRKNNDDASLFYITNPALLRIHTHPEPKDTVSTDTLSMDTISADSLVNDSVTVRADSADNVRHSTDEIRNSQKVDRVDKIVKEKMVIPRNLRGRRPVNNRRR